jgi:hypothetical protein
MRVRSVFVLVVVGLALAAVPSNGAERAPRSPADRVPSSLVGAAGQSNGGVRAVGSPAQWAPSYQVGVSFDPATGEVQLLAPRGRGQIDGSFELVSVTCTDCSGVCPPWGRTLEIVMRATAPVGAGFGVSSLTSTNYTVDPQLSGAVTYDPPNTSPLSQGQTVTVTVVGEVLACVAPRTNLYFDMCDVAPTDWSQDCQTGVAAVDFTSPTENFTNGAWSLGFEFTTNTAVTVTALGFFDGGQDGLAESHDVGIFDGVGNLLVSGTVTNGSALDGWFRYVWVTPTVLPAGAMYRIAAATGSENYTWDPTDFTVNPSITYIGDRYVASTTLAFPTEGPSEAAGYFGPNFKLTVP